MPDDTPGDRIEEPFGDKTSSALLPMFLDFYRQEVAAEEDVHRTLPFFATALGLIVAALNYVADKLPAWPQIRRACPEIASARLSWRIVECDWPAFVAIALLATSGILAVVVLGLLALATKRRGHRRIGPESAHQRRASDLRSYYQAQGLADGDLDAAISRDLRHQMIHDLASVVPFNRDLTLQRYRWRARAVACLLLALLCALGATILVVAIAKAGIGAPMPTEPKSSAAQAPEGTKSAVRNFGGGDASQPGSLQNPSAKPSGPMIYTVVKGANVFPSFWTTPPDQIRGG